jgi:hypothetical protein
MPMQLVAGSRIVAAGTDGAAGTRLRRIARAHLILSVLILSVLATGLTIGAEPAAAQGAAWCLRTSNNSGGGCSYHTFEQCLASRAGGSSHCVQNPNYAGSSSGRAQPRR